MSMAEQIHFDGPNPNRTVISSVTQIPRTRVTSTQERGILPDLRSILGGQISPVFYRSLIMFTCSVNLSYMSTFYAMRLQGDKFLILMVLGSAYSSGMMLSGVILSALKVRDTHAYMGALTMIIISNVGIS
mmetsp:Transcript_8570/g.14457  ORF Transcript_8570/g.14457 Transcript_8570/m.14457 type:complete len:131 (-) Transcript_8570:448-840(-)